MSDEISLVLHTGKVALELQPGQLHALKAKAGDRYRVVKAQGEEEQLLDNVIVKKLRNDLKLQFLDGTQVTLENYFVECRSSACDITLPGDPPSDGHAGPVLADGSSLLYAHGSQGALMQMAAGDAALAKAFAAGVAFPGGVGSELSYVPPPPVPPPATSSARRPSPTR